MLKGPPPILLRMIGPLVVFTTLVVFVSGLVLLPPEVAARRLRRQHRLGVAPS
jgi:hypothetical protein